MNCGTYRRMVCGLFVAAAGNGTLAGCSMAEEYEMGQAIEMGPFTFGVRSASASLEVQETRRTRVIGVTFRVLKDESRPRIDFDDFMNDMVGVQAKIDFIGGTHITLVDSHGHDFSSFVGGSGGRPHAKFWITSETDLLEWDVERIQRFREAHLETQPSDYRLIIENPDRREGQPRAVRIQLR